MDRKEAANRLCDQIIKPGILALTPTLQLWTNYLMFLCSYFVIGADRIKVLDEAVGDS